MKSFPVLLYRSTKEQEEIVEIAFTDLTLRFNSCCVKWCVTYYADEDPAIWLGRTADMAISKFVVHHGQIISEQPNVESAFSVEGRAGRPEATP